MAIDLDAVRKRFEQLSGNRPARRNDFWKPDVGEHKIRLVPMEVPEGLMFEERKFYYNIGRRPILAPSQFDKPDPIQETINKIRDDDTLDQESANEILKKMYPKSRAFAAVIVRGEESEGVRLWSFGKQVHQQLLGHILDPDYGDITDPLEGRDLKVTVIKKDGFKYPMVSSVDPRPKVTKLSDDSDQIEEWCNSIPDLNEIYSLSSYEEIEKQVNDWLSGGSTDDGQDWGEKKSTGSDTSSSSSSSGGSKSDFDKAFDDLMKKD
jgi:hypothetical protein